MELKITIASKIDEETDKKLTAYGNARDWEKSKTIRNILKSFLSENYTKTNV